MKTKYILLIIVLISTTQFSIATTYTWTGSVDTVFTNSNNWTQIPYTPLTYPGYPVSSDTAIIVSATNRPVLSSNHDVYRLVVTSGSFDLKGYTFTSTGSGSFIGGTIDNGTLVVRGAKIEFNGTEFNTTVDVEGDIIAHNGGIFNENCIFSTTGQQDSKGYGGCIFNGDLTIIHNGNNAKEWRMETATGDEFNGNLVLINRSNGMLVIAETDTTLLNGNLELNNIGGGLIYFGYKDGYSELASGKTISVGDSGFYSGELYFERFTQLGSTGQSLILTDSSKVFMKNCIFEGACTITSPEILCNKSTFLSATTITKTGKGENYWGGENIFEGPVTIANQYSDSTGSELRLADDPNFYNNDVVFESSGQPIEVVKYSSSEFGGNISINHAAISFRDGITELNAKHDQHLSGTVIFDFEELIINKDIHSVILNTPIEINSGVEFITGYIVSDSTNLVTFLPNSKANGAHNGSFVSGPVKKVGDEAFEFPVGKGEYFRYVSISAPANVTDAFTCEFYNTSQQLGLLSDTTLNYISDCMYWRLDRTSGSTNVNLSFSWDSSFCWTIDSTMIQLARWNSSSWVNCGLISQTGNRLSGTITTLDTMAAFGFFTFGSTSLGNNICGTVYELGTSGNSILASDILTDPALTLNGLISGNNVTSLGFSSPITISILGELIVDIAGFTFEKANIFMDQNSTITFLNSNNLSLNIHRTHIQGCKGRDMWEGIVIDGFYSNEVNVKFSSVIEDAETAIVSQNGGEFHVDNSILNKNNVGIMIDQFAFTHPGSFENNSQIKCASHFSNLIPGTLKSPFLGQTSHSGIFFPANGAFGTFIIGSGLTNQNLFFNLGNGIFAFEWNLEVYNNRFLSNQNGIRVQHNYFQGPGSSGIIVGTTGNGNDFEDCGNGIFAIMYSCVIENNSFLTGFNNINLSNGTIAGFQPSIIDILIHNNSFTDFGSRGIYTTSLTNTTTLEISENTFTRNINLVNGSTGIWIGASLSQNTDNLNIDNNEFNNVRTGILLNSINPPPNAPTKPKNVVKNNIFNFSNINVANTNLEFFGVNMVNSRGVWLATNDFFRFNGNASDEELNMFGIAVNNSISCHIINNEFFDIGTGMRLRTTNTGNRLRCNEFNDNHQSIRVGQVNAAATLTNQGTPALAWDNVWNGNGAAFRVDGTCNNFIWYHRTGSQFEPTNNFIFTTIGNINTTTACPINPPAAMPDRDLEIRPFIQDSVSYSDHENERKWLGLSNAYWTLMDDTTLINQSLGDDSIYVNFVNEMDTSNIGYFYQLERLVAESDYENATNLLNAIVHTNTIESNLKSFYEIYLETHTLGIPLDGSDSTALLSLADQRFLEGGPAVWLARHLLELEIDDDYEEESRFASNVQPLKSVGSSKIIIGNPARNELYLNCEKIDGHLDFELYNSTGLLVVQTMLKSKENLVNVANLSDGLYLYKIYQNNKVLQSGKLIILNE